MLLDVLLTGEDMADHSKKDKANAEFKKAQRAEDGRSAMAEYEAQAAAQREKTLRLRALRLARDAALPAAPPVAAKKKSAKSTKSGKGSPAKLSDWLVDQQKSGRNN
jgi:hypothetical protein